MKAQSLLRREQLRRALDRISALSRYSNVQEAASKLPQLLERMRHFYQTPLGLGPTGTKKQARGADLAFDRITTRGLALKTGLNEETLEQWKLDIMNWLSDGETLLRDDFPSTFVS